MNGPKLASASIADSLPALTVLRGSCVVFLADGSTEKNIDEIARMHEAIPPGREYANRSQCSDATRSGGFDRRKDRKYLDLIARIRHRNIGDLMRYLDFEPGEKAFCQNEFEVDGCTK